MSKLWGGRFTGQTDSLVQRYNASIGFDIRLYDEDITGSVAWAGELAEIGLLTEVESAAIIEGLEQVRQEFAEDRFAVLPDDEDIHSAVERRLTELVGPTGGKLHTGRSRNDQVATLFRMRVMALCDQAIEDVRQLERALVGQAHAAGDLACAAYTHLQPAQPVLLAHFWMAHVHALERDEERFAAAREAADRLPLGSGAVAGSPLRYDRYALAQRLGFSRLAANSLDAVGDRDFALEYLNAAAMLGLHLSRLAEDLVLACSPGFGWFAAPDGFSTGSSLLPQKRNPDLFELARGKAARFLANAQRLAVLLKGLPSAYQKDLQEDKEAVFDTAAHLDSLLEALAPAIAALKPNPEKLAEGLTPDLLAVELADALVEDGVPFRDAHRAVGQLWAAAEAKGVEPAALAPEVRLAIHAGFTDERLAALSVEAALARRSHAPGAGPGSVAEQLAHADARLGLGPGEALTVTADFVPSVRTPQAPTAAAPRPDVVRREDGVVIRRARVDDVPGIAAVMADYVAQGVLLPRPVSELFQCVREFWVAEEAGAVIATAALRLLWHDLGEVRSLAVRPDSHGKGLGAALVEAVVGDARALGLPRVIALTREVEFFARNGFVVVQRETLPRKVWTDCMKCPRRHACDEVAVSLDLVPGASEEAAKGARAYTLPMPQVAFGDAGLPIIS